jgi:hypothetical protein
MQGRCTVLQLKGGTTRRSRKKSNIPHQLIALTRKALRLAGLTGTPCRGDLHSKLVLCALAESANERTNSTRLTCARRTVQHQSQRVLPIRDIAHNVVSKLLPSVELGPVNTFCTITDATAFHPIPQSIDALKVPFGNVARIVRPNMANRVEQDTITPPPSGRCTAGAVWRSRDRGGSAQLLLRICAAPTPVTSLNSTISTSARIPHSPRAVAVALIVGGGVASQKLFQRSRFLRLRFRVAFGIGLLTL